MPHIHQVATITSKGQITLPKPIRQALGIDVGDQVAFDFNGQSITVSRVEAHGHSDPAIAQFLALLERDLEAGKNIMPLSSGLASSLQKALKYPVDLNEEIDGDVSL